MSAVVRNQESEDLCCRYFVSSNNKNKKEV